MPPSVSNSAWSFLTVTVIGRVMLESANMQPSTLPGATASVNTARALGSTGPDRFGVGMFPPVWVQPLNSVTIANAAVALSLNMSRSPSPRIIQAIVPATIASRPSYLLVPGKEGGHEISRLYRRGGACRSSRRLRGAVLPSLRLHLQIRLLLSERPRALTRATTARGGWRQRPRPPARTSRAGPWAG